MNEKDSRGKGANPEEPGPGAKRREPVFSDFDDDEAFEELDRDRDFASAYEAEDPEEDDDYDPDEDDEYDEDADWQPLAPEVPDSGEAVRSGGNPWDAPSADAIDEDDEPLKPVPRVSREVEDPVADEYDDEEEWDEEEYEEPEVQQEYPDEGAHGWPVGLIIVAVVALVLLAAGGYGVVQQRAATQGEIRELQAALATAASPAEVAQTREALQAMEEDLDRQLATIETLTLENRRLTDTVAGLESQLAAQQAAAATTQAAPKPAPKPKPAAKPAPKPAPKPAAAKPAATGDWFVNFSSYSQRSAAESWLAKIKPAAGKAVIQPVTSNGATLYRVRVIGLADRGQAEKVAAQLQAAHGLPKLWVGSE